MAYTTINKSTDYFNTKLYTGNAGTQSITGVGFKPDWVWIKNRDGTRSHYLFDAVRGVTKELNSNNANDENTNANGLTTFGTDGFTLGSEGEMNANSATFASWNWKGGGGQGSSNTDGSINTTYTSVNTTAGFSISKYTGTGSNATVGHGLGVAPKMIIEKQIDSGSNDWGVYHASQGAGKYTKFNTTEAFSSHTGVWQNVEPTNTVFSLGNSSLANASSGTHIAYCFAEKKGYSKFGSYTGNGNANGTFIYTGFKPSFIMLKGNNSENWMMYDNKREGYNVDNDSIHPNTNDAEGTADDIDILSNGFKIRRATGLLNDSGVSYYYMAFGQSLVGSNNVPCTAR